MGTARLVVTIPKAPSTASSARRSPAYVSAATQSLTVNVTPHGSGTPVSGFPMTANLTSTSTGCTSTLVSTQCTIAFQLAAANYDVTITSYDGLNGGGNVLSAAQTVPVTIAEGQANTLPISLGGVPTSVKIVPAGGTGGSQNLVLTLPVASTGSLRIYGVDADGNYILGAGAPAIAATTSISGPSATAPDTFTVTSLTASAATSIVRITATATPVAGTGTGAVSATATLQAPTLPLLYVANYGGNAISVFDALGDQLAPAGGFAGAAAPYSVTYDSNDQFIYVSSGASTPYVKAYDRNGNPQTLSGSFPGLPTYPTDVTFDPQNDLIYVLGGATAQVYDENGNAASISPGFSAGGYAMAYDPQNGFLYSLGGSSLNAWDANGNPQSLTGGFAGATQSESVAYNATNNLLYVAYVYGSQILAFTANGTAVALSGTFPGVDGSANQPFAIAANPVNGDIYVSMNTGQLYAFDANGNALWTASGYVNGLGMTVAPPP